MEAGQREGGWSGGGWGLTCCYAEEGIRYAADHWGGHVARWKGVRLVGVSIGAMCL